MAKARPIPLIILMIKTVVWLNWRSSIRMRASLAGWLALDLETRRAIIDAALVEAGVRALPPRPLGEHVVADLMAFYFRSSEANDLAYRALINREVCRPIAITTRKPAAL